MSTMENSPSAPSCHTVLSAAAAWIATIASVLCLLMTLPTGEVGAVTHDMDDGGANASFYRYIQYQTYAARITQPPRDQRVVDNGIVSFHCLAVGNPVPEVFWRRAGKRIQALSPITASAAGLQPSSTAIGAQGTASSGVGRRYFVVDIPHGSVLRIEPAKARRDDGTIECVAENGAGEPATASAKVEVYAEGLAPAGYPRIVENPSLKAVEKDRSTVMICSAIGNPDPSIIWYKDYAPVDITDPRLKILPTGSLQIRHSLESDEGKYECVAENSIGVAFSYGANLYVRVRRVPPHFSVPPDSVEVMPGGAVNLTCVAIGSPMPEVRWRLGPLPLTPEDSAPVGKNVLMLRDVFESATYTCVAASDLGSIEYDAEVRVKALPKPPTSLIVTDVTPDTVRLSWNSGNTEPISSYVVQFRAKYASSSSSSASGSGNIDPPNESFREVVDVGHTDYVISGLLPFTVHEIRVLAVNGVGRSTPSVSVEATTAELAPGSPPVNVRARPVSSSTAVVQWDEPHSPNGVIRGYKVHYTLAPDLSVNLWTVHPVEGGSELTTISNLLTNRTYTIRILAYTVAGDGPLSGPVHVKMQPGVPEQPTNLQGEPTSPNTIQLTWDAPETSPDDVIESYELYYNDSHFRQNVRVTISPPRNTYLLEDLTPDTVYHIRVAARSARGEGASTPTVQVRTMEFIPPRAPVNVSAQAVNSSSIQVTWSPFRLPGLKAFHVLVRSVDQFFALASDGKQGDRQYYQPLQQVISESTMEALRSVPARIIVVAPNVSTATIGDLEKYHSYSVSVAAIVTSSLLPGNKTESPYSDPIIVRTEEDVPGEPRKVKVEPFNSTAVNVQWRPPMESDLNGIIRGYRIHYVQLTGSDDEQAPDTVYAAKVFDIPDGSRTEAIIGGLQADTAYQFQVVGYTRKGDGEKTKPRKVKTKGAVPSPPRGLHLSLTQEDPPIVAVTWSTPRHTHGTIVGYKLTYGVRGDSYVEERRFETDKYRFTTGFLDRGADYEFRVSAKNAVDFGEPATETFRTPDGVPGAAPHNFTATGLSPTSVRLQWNPPSQKLRNGDVIMYEVVYRRRGNELEDLAVNSTDLQITIEGLDVNADYVFQLRAYTSKGSGPWSNRLPFRTFGNHVLPAPVNVQLRRVSSTAYEVSWDAARFPGVSGYSVFYRSVPLPSSDVDNPNADGYGWTSIDIGPFNSAEIPGLEPTGVYAVKVRARGTDGRYGNISETVWTKRREVEHPQACQDFHVKNQDSRTITLEWKPPKTPGVFRYKVEYQGIKQRRDPLSNIEDTLIDRKDQMVVKEQRSLLLDHLLPNSIYTFNITALFIDGSWGPANSIRVEIDSEAPSGVDAPRLSKTYTDGTVAIKLRPSRNEASADVTHYLIMVIPEEMSSQKSPADFRLEEMDVRRPGHGDDKLQRGQLAWVAARYAAGSLPSEMRLGDGSWPGTGEYYNGPLGRPSKGYRIVLRAMTASNKQTSSPYSDHVTVPSPDPPTPLATHRDDVIESNHDAAGTNLLWIVAPICAAVVLCLLVVLFVVVARKRRIAWKRAPPLPQLRSKLITRTDNEYGTSPVISQPLDPVEMRRIQYSTPALLSHPPIAVVEFVSHVAYLKLDDAVRFAAEYESIDPGGGIPGPSGLPAMTTVQSSSSNIPPLTWEASVADGNRAKNRYANVVAYDHSRVHLRSPGGSTDGGDYINANYIDGFRRSNAYIATQGPLVETYNDFWRMVWEQRCSGIVMMTNLEERNRIKCDQYWPVRGTESYGSVHVTALDVIELATYTIRTFQLSRDGSDDKIEIRQFQFTAWPDHGVPNHPTPLLLFMRRVKFMANQDGGPLVVHCSAGVGRTGAFIVIDSQLERIRHMTTVDIYGQVTLMRSQRNYMVQTEDQYIFVHNAIVEAIQSGNTEVPGRSLLAHVHRLSERSTVPAVGCHGNQTAVDGEPPGSQAHTTAMTLEFRRLIVVQMASNQDRFVSANLPCNKAKNRLVNVLPFESTRVLLQPIRGVEGSDFINASYIDGYRFRRAYIATQGPLAETTEDFWRMLWENNCNIVVMLTKLRELGREKCHQYWPSERSARYQYFVVDPLAEYNMPHYVLREFKVTDARDGQSRTVRQFQFTDWPEQGVPPSGEGFIELIGQVHKTKDQFGHEGPVTVHCSAGVGRTGVFIALSIVLERLKYEGVIDMFQTVNMLRVQRALMVQSEDQYAFCYRSALEYLGSFDHFAI